MQKLCVISGSGLSASAGLSTFRGPDGLWRNHDPMTLATPEAWDRDRGLVTEFYNERRALAWQADPTAAHWALARLEDRFETTIVTQNVDSLHERAGSSRVLHLHGELDWVRDTADASNRKALEGAAVDPYEPTAKGGYWRPNVVWFGEGIHHYDDALNAVATADRVIVVGTSLTVQPAASMMLYASENAEKVVVNAEPLTLPDGFRFIQSPADEALPTLAEQWLDRA